MRQRQRGSALIEFAGSLILLSTVFAGVFQIGYTFFAYNTLINAVRAGARYASLQTARDPNVIRAVENLVVYGDLVPSPGAKPAVPGLATSNVELKFGPSTATVCVRGFKLDSLFSQVTLDGRPLVTFPMATFPRANGAAK